MILTETDPYKIKKYGRKVKNFDNKIWDKVKYDIMYQANILKYSQNEDLLKLLLSTEGNKLVEASPYDSIWGIGFIFFRKRCS